MIKYIKGDATQPQGDGNKIIVHVCNDKNRWGSGFVLAISKRWKQPEENYRGLNNWERVLGSVQYVQVESNIYVGNMIAQHDTQWIDGIPPIRYSALRLCLLNVYDEAKRLNASVHGPMFGAGLAGGNWDEIEVIINQCLLDIDVTIYKF